MDSEEKMDLNQVKTQNETLAAMAKVLDLKNVELEDLKQSLARSKTRYQCGMLLLGIFLIVIQNTWWVNEEMDGLLENELLKERSQVRNLTLENQALMDQLNSLKRLNEAAMQEMGGLLENELLKEKSQVRNLTLENQGLMDQLNSLKRLNEAAMGFKTRRTDFDNTELHRACKLENIDYEFMLLVFGSDPNAKNEDEETPLHFATRTGNWRVVSTLLMYDPDVNLVNKDQESALHLATRIGIMEIIEDLVTHGADINVMNLRKETPLHLAVLNGNFQAAKNLLFLGANKYLKNDRGQDSLTLAKNNKQTDIITLLESDEFMLGYDYDTPKYK